MKSRIAVGLGLALGAAILTYAADGSWTGYISDSHCAAKGAKAGHEECAAKCVKDGAKYVFVDDSSKKVFTVDPADKVAAHAGHHVVVKGTVDGDTMKVSSVEMAK